MASDHVVLITGASSGFGLLTARALAEKGHTVYAAMRDIEGHNAKIAAEVREADRAGAAPLHVIEMDVTSTESVDAAVGRIIDAEGRIDVVVNNAGVMHVGVTEAFTVQQFATQLDTNLVGVFRVDQAVLPHMRERRSGLLVHVSSVLGRYAFPFYAGYHASKFGIEGFAESLRYEVSNFGIDVIIVEPGPFTTNLLPNNPGPDNQEVVAAYGEVAKKLDDILEGMDQVFADEQTPTDPQIFADTMVQLIDMPVGERPCRVSIGMDFGIIAMNRMTEPFRLGMLKGLGLEHMEGVKAAAAGRS